MMEIAEEKKSYVRFKLEQAAEAYQEALGLLQDGADLRYVVNSLYYAFYYPAIGLLSAQGLAPTMQSVSIALFELQFISSGIVENRFFRSLRRAFELKPKCSDRITEPIDRAEVEALLTDARDFQTLVASVVG